MSLLVSVLIFLVVACVILWFVSFILDHIPVGPMPRNLILAAVGLILLLAFLQRTGLL